MTIAPLSLSSLRLSPSAPDLLFPSASDLWFRALPRAFLCRFQYIYLSLPSLDPRLYGTEGGGLDVEDLGDSIVVVVKVVLKD